MIDYIRFYLVNENQFMCKVSFGGKEKRIFQKDSTFIKNMIKKWKIYPQKSTNHYVEYHIEDFSNVNTEELKHMIYICRKSPITKCLNRELSKKVKAQVLGITAMTLFSMTSLLNSLSNDIDTNDYKLLYPTAITNMNMENTNMNMENIESNIELAINLPLNNIINNNQSTITVWSSERSNDPCIENSQSYREEFQKFGNQYGIDEKLLMAIAAQENSGVHSSTSQNGAAIGIMQIEMSVWENQEITAYNFNTCSYETVTIEKESLSDCNYNIKIAAMILQSYLMEYQYNLPIALQTYNIGPGNMNKVLTAYSNEIGLEIDNIISNPYDQSWRNYLNYANGGDKEYLENVLSFLQDGTELTITKPDGNINHIFIDNINNNIYENNSDFHI